MQLSYRGCQYEKQAVILGNNIHPINTKYRGVNYILGSGQPQIRQSSILLKYRGVSYQGTNKANDNYVENKTSDNLYINCWSI